MKLFEVYSGWTGETYERAYVWAQNEDEAKRLSRTQYTAQFKGGYRDREDGPVEAQELRLQMLFDSEDEGPFCTSFSGSGWWTKKAIQPPSVEIK